ncbi:MAG TPA: AAA family ATPase, partial [Chloroflexota bacterium]|nr:AAA family ATPase [Chloroflexota bacterium]
LILVGGAPATGKTTLAKCLGEELGYPFLNKDLIKESLFDALGSPDRVRSAQLSIASYLVLYRIARRLIDAGTSHVLESNFQRGVSEKELLPLVQTSRAVLIHCGATTEALARRYARRASDGSRHPGHHDGALGSTDLERLANGVYAPLDLPIPILRVDTTGPYRPEFETIVEFVRTQNAISRRS